MSSNQYIKAKELGLPKPEISEETRKKLSEVHKGRKLSEEQKRKISETQKKNFANGKSRWAFNRSNQSYAEKYFEEWLSSFSEFKMNLHVNRYFLDFAWPEKWIYLEIDGEQHFENQTNIEHDKEREKILEAEGWKCIGRVRWSWFKGLTLDEKNKYLESLKNIILGEATKLTVFISNKEKRDNEYLQKVEEARQLGMLTKNGHLHNSIKPSYVWEERKNLILNSGVDLTLFGWKTKVKKATGLSRRIIDDTIEHFTSEFNNVIFIKKGTVT